MEEENNQAMHWSAVLANEEETDLSPFLQNLYENDQYKNTIENLPYIGLLASEGPIRCLMLFQYDFIEQGNNFITAYPFVQNSNTFEVKIEEIYPFNNDLEAVITGTLISGLKIGFYDTSFFANRDLYETGASYFFNISALAYSMEKRTDDLEYIADDGSLKGQLVQTRGLNAYYQDEENWDDFAYLFEITEEIDSVKFENQNFYKLNYKVFTEDNEELLLDMPIFVNKNILKDYYPRKHDNVQGIAWMTGYLSETEIK